VSRAASRSSIRKPKGMFRRIERWGVGLAMGVVAFVLEKVVMRSVNKGNREPAHAEAAPTTFRSKGGEVDLDE
jgi:hypothetical protein